MSNLRRRNCSSSSNLPGDNDQVTIDRLKAMIEELLGESERDVRTRTLRLVMEQLMEYQEIAERRFGDFAESMHEATERMEILNKIPMDKLRLLAQNILAMEEPADVQHDADDAGTVDEQGSNNSADVRAPNGQGYVYRPMPHREPCSSRDQPEREVRWSDQRERYESRSWMSDRRMVAVHHRWERTVFQSSDYKLTQESNYIQWRDKIVSEIQSQGCEFLLNENPVIPIDLSDAELKILKYKVKAFILKHLDDWHHSLVLNEEEPLRILTLLDQGEPKAVTVGVKKLAELAHMEYEPHLGSATEFIAHFTNKVAEAGRHGVKAADETLRHYFLIGTSKFMRPSLEAKGADAVARMNLADLKSELLKAEAHFHELNPDFMKTKALFGRRGHNHPKPKEREAEYPQKHNRCFKCGATGHTKPNCTSTETYCYGCHTLTDHIRRNCPETEGQRQTWAEAKADSNSKPSASGINAAKQLTVSKADKPSLAKPKKQWKRVPFKVAKRINKNRTRKGKAALAFRDERANSVDEDELVDEDTVMLSLAGLDEDELFACYAEMEADDSRANYAMEDREEELDYDEADYNWKWS